MNNEMYKQQKEDINRQVNIQRFYLLINMMIFMGFCYGYYKIIKS
jgi:hypothetical protein